MARPWRIAVAGIRHETNTFSPIQTTLEDFHVVEGEELLGSALRSTAAAAGAELVPLCLASALPGGLVGRDVYEHLRDSLLDRLVTAGRIDGLYLDLHGAMEVEGIGDGETDLVRAIRRCVGQRPLVSISLDLHGNISPELVRSADLLTALRTAPHVDHEDTRQRALANMLAVLERGDRAAAAIVKIPMVLPGEAAMTNTEPARSLYARLVEVERRPGMLDASILVGCAWTDSPHAVVSTVAVAERDKDVARAEARALAKAIWARRTAFTFGLETAPLETALAEAMASAVHPVFVTDSGDNVTAGAAGDLPVVTERLLALGATRALIAGLVDAESVAACGQAGVGAQVPLSVGAKLDRGHGEPVSVRGRVLDVQGESAGEAMISVVECGGVTVILTADRRAFLTRSSMQAVGVDPLEYEVVVVKQGYLFPDLATHAARVIMALTPGASDLRVAELQYEWVPRPCFPLDGDFAWEPDSTLAA